MSLPKKYDQRKTNQSDDALQLAAGDANTWCAILTGTGRSAVAVIGVHGSEAQSIVARCFVGATKSPFLPGQIRYGVWRGEGSSEGESVVMTPCDADHFEIHCHGGPAATARIIEDLTQAGAVHSPLKVVDSLGGQSELHREAIGVVSHCTTSRTAAIAMDQVRGALHDWVVRSRQQLNADQFSIERIAEEASQMLRFADFGTRLTKPFQVVFAGPPNVGKSSLLNAIVGYDRSITMDAEGTTRDILHADTVIDGLPIRLSDTAGIRDSSESIEKQGIAKALQATRSADLVVCVAQPSDFSISNSKPDLAGFENEFLDLEQPQPAQVHVLNKSDLISHKTCQPKGFLLTNALNGDGIPELILAISRSLNASQPPSGSPVPITNRQVGLLKQIAQESNDSSKESILGKLHELCGFPGEIP